ncbi:hypothetical protein [Streptomyces fractus]|uniref:hypothetical protein n=1 Tax=Streptomyces fractus TaxID=641806 RepID=UPI003CF1745E
MPDYRYIITRATTGEVLHWNVPLSGVSYGPELNGPGSLTATLKPVSPRIEDLLDAGDTVLLIERNGDLDWGGLLWRSEDQNAQDGVEGSGFTSYLHKRFDLHGNLEGRGPYVEADPCQVIRDVWAYAQQAPDGDLGVTVDDTTSTATTGTAKTPYATHAWEPRNLGDMVDEMADVDDGLEWSETVTWRDGHAERRILLGTPQLGRRRTDLTFTTGANVTGDPQVIKDADAYAQWVIGLGAGEGRKRKVAIDGERNGRLRLETLLETSEKDVAKLKARTRRERRARQVLPTLTELEIADHPAAPLNALRVGDLVRIQLHEPHPIYDGWNRITGWTVRPGDGETLERITLTLERALTPEEDDAQAEEA